MQWFIFVDRLAGLQHVVLPRRRHADSKIAMGYEFTKEKLKELNWPCTSNEGEILESEREILESDEEAEDTSGSFTMSRRSNVGRLLLLNTTSWSSSVRLICWLMGKAIPPCLFLGGGSTAWSAAAAVPAATANFF